MKLVSVKNQVRDAVIKNISRDKRVQEISTFDHIVDIVVYRIKFIIMDKVSTGIGIY